MAEQPGAVVGQRWFHTIVVVGASLTGAVGCTGHRAPVTDAAVIVDLGSPGDGRALPDRAGSDGGSTGPDVGGDASAIAQPDGGTDVRDGGFDYPHITLSVIR